MEFFIVTCEETDLFEGKILHINKKAKNVEEICKIIMDNINKYPAAHWELYPCSVKI